MPMLVAAVVVLTVLVVLDLVLTTAVIRRLRTYEDSRSAAGAPPETIRIAVGAEVPEFADADGRRTLVGFFSTTCKPCVTEAAELVRREGRLTAAGIAVVPVLTQHGEEDPNGLRTVLAAVGTVVTEAPGGPVSTAFGTRATPSYVLVDPDGRVAAKGAFEDCLQLAAA
ncbi:TlpA family protein disulfide reductase [Dactylosporangium sp. CA-139066]|uniref:TlpA family protein disulfide reductase n=1 Tax=Dactylosporangium sp. CA-139066 TaxID=3239930 RepID=UPI003D915B3B